MSFDGHQVQFYQAKEKVGTLGIINLDIALSIIIINIG
jgi:hypothetical protein